MSDDIVLVLHRKSCNEPYVKQAIKTLRKEGHKLRVLVPYNQGFSVSGIARELEEPMNPGNIHVIYRQLAEFTLQSIQKMHCNLDGEPLRKKKLRFRVLPRHLKVAY